MKIGNYLFPTNLLVTIVLFLFLIIIWINYIKFFSFYKQTSRIDKHKLPKVKTVHKWCLFIISVIIMMILFVKPLRPSENIEPSIYEFNSLSHYLSYQLKIVEEDLTPETYESFYFLKLDHKRFKTLDGIEKMKNLNSVKFEDVILEDASALARVPSLKDVYFYHSTVINSYSLRELTQITRLEFYNMKLLDFDSFLPCLTQLKFLLMFNVNLNLYTLTNLTQLEMLIVVRGLSNADLTPLQNLEQLKELNLSENQITNITPLSHLIQLKSLELSNNLIDDLTPLANLYNLQELYLSNNHIHNIKSLENLIKLQTLYLGNNQITEIISFNHYNELKTLSLEGNLITDISLLNHNLKLNQLYLADNKIENIEPISNMNVSQEINLSGNLISDLHPLLTFATQNAIKHIYIENNNLDLNPNSDDFQIISQIQEKGIYIIY